jgi:anti-sigma regulatory factor (Ser/Thr protein kinase)
MPHDSFRHEALIYRDAEELLATAVPFLREGIEAGEPALVAVRGANATLLQGELGAEADRVGFADMETLGRNPARIIPFWRDFVDEHGGGPVRGIGEPVWPGRGPAEIDECQRHESLLNVAFSALPAWTLLCPYDAGGLDDEVLAAVAHSHRAVARDGQKESSTSFAPDLEWFGGSLPDPPRETSYEFDRTGLFGVRQRVGWAAKSAGLPAEATVDLIVAASELAANSIVHGGGAGTLHIWREPDRLLVEIVDRGSIEEPLVGRIKPDPARAGGRGLWLANQLCDLVQIRSGATGTAVRLQMSLG